MRYLNIAIIYLKKIYIELKTTKQRKQGNRPDIKMQRYIFTSVIQTINNSFVQKKRKDLKIKSSYKKTLSTKQGIFQFVEKNTILIQKGLCYVASQCYYKIHYYKWF